MPACTLYEALATLPDPRSRHGRIHPLPAVMGLVALAMLSGRKSLAGISRFGRQHGAPLAHAWASGGAKRRPSRPSPEPSAASTPRTAKRPCPGG
ncbi:transposase family protein [Fimbriiglobus ruber]|uniref:transposase family protein n=1 Tax=Fimbriiglobus ruber TaxID=1908690 RepID=UPI001EE6F73A|nr:transposase family protein [Fimbriiglobus ruber]